MPEQITLMPLTPHEGSSVEAPGLSELGPFKSPEEADKSLIVVRDRLNKKQRGQAGYLQTGDIDGEAPPGFDMDGSDRVGYYHPLKPEDPIL